MMHITEGETMTLSQDLLTEISGLAPPHEPPDGWADTADIAAALGYDSTTGARDWLRKRGIDSMRLLGGRIAWNLEQVKGALG